MKKISAESLSLKAFGALEDERPVIKKEKQS